jgi:hypothetical protein
MCFYFKMNFIISDIVESFIISQYIALQHGLLNYANFIEWLNPK